MTTTTDAAQGQPTAGPGAALAWTSTRDDLPRQPWTDRPGAPLRNATRVDLKRREIIAPTDSSTLGRTLRLRATIHGRYGVTPTQRAALTRTCDRDARPYIDTAHGLAMDAMTRRAAQRAGMAWTLDDGTAPAIAAGIAGADPATAWNYAAPYLDENGALPDEIAQALATHHPALSQGLDDRREQITDLITSARDYLAAASPQHRRHGRYSLRRLAEVLAYTAANAATLPRRNGGGDIPRVASSLWADLAVEMPPLVVANYARTGRTYIPADTGRHPRYMARALTDPARRVFHRRGGFRHATIVADLSGSMSLTSADLAAIVDAARGCSLLAYRSCRGPYTAQVMARDGRTCEPSRRFTPGGGNGVDGPAVTWAHQHLRRHGAPLIWISDGHITGRNEDQSPALARDMVARLQHANAHQASSVEDALSLLAAMRAGHRPRPQVCDYLANLAQMAST